VASDIACHREVGGEGIITVCPTDIDQITQTLYNVLSDRNLKNRLINAGLTNKARFSWQKAAETTAQLYQA